MKRDLTWQEGGDSVALPWVSEAELSPPKKILLADDRLTADDFYRQASEGAAFIYGGDFQNAKQLLQAVQRRIDKHSGRKAKREREGSAVDDASTAKDLFHRHRQTQAHKAQLLSRILIRVEADFSISLRRAPDVREAVTEALGTSFLGDGSQTAFLVSLRELLGYIGAHEWRKNGVAVGVLGVGAKIFPHYGLFSPVRGEYLELVAKAPIPTSTERAFDIGTGTGVIAALLAKRGVAKIVATDLDDRALICAKENVEHLGYSSQVEIVKADLFPEGSADLIVCNPPWVPARPTSPLERAVYDEGGQMLKGFLRGVSGHLTSHGEAWLIISDLAELLGIRTADEIPSLISAGGLELIETLEIRPQHVKASDSSDPLHAARSREVTKLWRLRKAM